MTPDSIPITDLSKVTWDYVIVGTGMGGATLGHALAQAGQKVLFLERGENYLKNPRALRGDYMEVLTKTHPLPGTEEEIALNSGRWRGEIFDAVQKRTFRPMLGRGAGGASALYGMVLNRFFPSDFEPRRYHPGDTESTLPDRWPVTYEEMLPYYLEAEKLYRVHSAEVDPLRAGEPFHYEKAPVPQHIVTRIFERVMRAKKLNVHTVPFACEWKLNCQFCQSFLCDKECKNDANTICLQPAIDRWGAALLTRFDVTRLEADRGRVTGVWGTWRGDKEIRFTANRVVLAAGALATPLILLRSRSDHWPHGLANGSGAVGRNLMRHLIDFYILPALFNLSKSAFNLKELAWNDFYEVDGVKYGTFQPLGKLPPGFMIMEDLLFEMKQTSPRGAALFSLVRPLAALLLNGLFSHSGCAAPILEDLPLWENRVEEMAPAPDGRERVAVHYRITDYDHLRRKNFRRMIGRSLRPYPFLRLPMSETSKLMAHACGTVRFGEDPNTSVLNRMNRAHQVENLYVVDASFFPSSGGINPSLTIAANALRVARHLMKGQA